MGFRFSHDRLFGKFGLEDFLRTATKLKKISDQEKSHINPIVLTCEDRDTYNLSKVSFALDEVDKALEQRREYRLEKVDEEVWNRSLRLEFNLTISDIQSPFRIHLIYDKEEEHRLFFYGHGLDEKIYDAIWKKFHKKGLPYYTLGDGFGKPSVLTGGIIESGYHLRH